MPIIPRVDSIQGDIPVSRVPGVYATPDISAFPGFTAAQRAEKVSQVGQAWSDAGLRGMAEQEAVARKKKSLAGYLQAENLKSELAIKLQAAAEDAKNAPAQVREGIALSSGDPGGLDEPSATTSIIPRSTTLLPDYLKAQDAIVEDIRKRGGSDESVLRYLEPGIARVTKESTMRMQSHVGTLQDEEMAAQVLDGVRMRAREIGTRRPAPPVYNADQVPTLDPEQDYSYTVLRNGVVQTIDKAVAMGAIKPNQAERIKGSELAKIDHGRATQTMLANPTAWLAASSADTNGWNARLTPEAFARLDTRATEITKQATESRNQARLARQREIEQDWFSRVGDGVENPLTVQEIEDRVTKTREMDAEHGTKWKTLVTNLKLGKWEDNGELKVRMGLQALSLNVTEKFLDEIDSVVRPGGLSLETALDYKAKAKATITHRSDKDKQEGYQSYHAAQTAGLSTLTTTPLLGAKMDQDSKTVQGNYLNALYANAQRNGWETSGAWHLKNLPFYSRQLEDRVDSQINVLSREIPEKLKTDPKTGDITPDTIKAARQQAFKRYDIDPKKAATLDVMKLPEGLRRELNTIDQLNENAKAKQSLNLKNKQGN